MECLSGLYLHDMCLLVSTVFILLDSIVNPMDVTLKLVWQRDEPLPRSTHHGDFSELIYR